MAIDSILFMFTGLSLGILITQLSSRLNESLPYTVIIFVIGIVIAVISQTRDGLWDTSVQEWSSLDPETIIMIFLPPLVFGEAMSLNWFHVLGGFWQSLLLAGPGVVVGAFAIGGLTKFILPYSWSWTLAMVFGSILSATDTAAVVALLKGANASPKLTILIVGESLLNDGAAMITFDIFLKMLTGEEPTTFELIKSSVNATVGSAFFGVICGLVMVYWMRSADRRYKYEDSATQIYITVCCGYLVFFIAQNVLYQSGVIACVFSGAMLAWLAPPIILNQEAMHHVWGMIEWLGNTLLFLIAGLKLGGMAWNHLNWLDCVFLVVLYVLVNVVRAATIAIFYPIISRIGHKCKVNEAIFMSWAGIRGAVPIALALIVTSNKHHSFLSRADSARLFFYVGGISALTLLINATLAKSVLRLLGLVGDYSFEKLVITHQLRKRLRGRMAQIANELETQERFNADEMGYIRSTCTLLKDLDRIIQHTGSETNSIIAVSSERRVGDSSQMRSPSVHDLSSVLLMDERSNSIDSENHQDEKSSSRSENGCSSSAKQAFSPTRVSGPTRTFSIRFPQAEPDMLILSRQHTVSNAPSSVLQPPQAATSSTSSAIFSMIFPAPPTSPRTQSPVLEAECEHNIEVTPMSSSSPLVVLPHISPENSNDPHSYTSLARSHHFDDTNSLSRANGNESLSPLIHESMTATKSFRRMSPSTKMLVSGMSTNLKIFDENQHSNNELASVYSNGAPSPNTRLYANLSRHQSDKLTTPKSSILSQSYGSFHSRLVNRSEDGNGCAENGEIDFDEAEKSDIVEEEIDNIVTDIARDNLKGEDDLSQSKPHEQRKEVLVRILSQWEPETNASISEHRPSDSHHLGMNVVETTSLLPKQENLSPHLVQYFRTVLLEIVRARYWKEIESGRLPRNSYSARFLLHSIDVGLDNIVNATNLQDWTWIEKNLNIELSGAFVTALSIGEWLNSTSIANFLGHWEARLEKRMVYVLTSFIEAHKHAQSKLREYAGVSCQIDDNTDLAPLEREYEIVRQESIDAVKHAKSLLDEMDPATVKSIRLQQASRMLLARQGQLVDNMLDEGVMTYQNAEELFDEIEHDVEKLETDRVRILKMHEDGRAKRRFENTLEVRDVYRNFRGGVSASKSDLTS